MKSRVCRKTDALKRLRPALIGHPSPRRRRTAEAGSFAECRKAATEKMEQARRVIELGSWEG